MDRDRPRWYKQEVVGGVFEDGYPNALAPRLTIGDALHRWLDRIEAVYEVVPPVGERGEPIPTGIVELDVVLAGGAAVGEVVVIAGDSALQRRALTATVARSCRRAGLYAVEDPVALVRLMLAGRSGVPEVLLRTGELTGQDWDAINSVIWSLAHTDVQFSAASTLAALWGACDGSVPLLLVDEAQRLGLIGAVAEDARRLADERRVAVVLITDGAADRVQESVGPAGRVIAVASDRMDSGATFLDPATLTLAHARVGTLHGHVGTTDDVMG